MFLGPKKLNNLDFFEKHYNFFHYSLFVFHSSFFTFHSSLFTIHSSLFTPLSNSLVFPVLVRWRGNHGQRAGRNHRVVRVPVRVWATAQ